MPEISRFYGIVIFMNFNDHAPAHFHVWYGKYKATIDIAPEYLYEHGHTVYDSTGSEPGMVAE